jgi:hypothetical protein
MALHTQVDLLLEAICFEGLGDTYEKLSEKVEPKCRPVIDSYLEWPEQNQCTIRPSSLERPKKRLLTSYGTLALTFVSFASFGYILEDLGAHQPMWKLV